MRTAYSNTCQHKRQRLNYTYDASYCLDCREWIESKCSDPDCEYCAKRPGLAPEIDVEAERMGLIKDKIYRTMAPKGVDYTAKGQNKKGTK